ncbi:SLC13 family permease [Ruficoccus amylovorans]|uniref:SLC13 family permease n=1 Tax=Ruficoccus amylovorans TaxID=1804625 RepID=A0A842HCF5_9BACT|nr:SLC13 family permease [Ruficoccus amylovorans]MBC2594102.1 SLC13 family permease [Ruficoccus amylovorans]
MTWEIIAVLFILLAALASFIAEKVSVDVTAVCVFAVLLVVSMVSGSDHWPEVGELVNVFANSAPLTIGAMFIISVALEKCGAIELMAQKLGKLTALPYGVFIVALAIGVGGISAFINNTPVVVVFMPVIISLARQMKTPASQLLIPLSYLSIFGGVCTLMGTSTNILMSGIIKDHGQPPLGMFELALVGIPLMVLGTAYLAFFGKKILPVRETLTAILSEEERKEYITEAYVKQGTELDGQSFSESGLKRTRGIRLLEIIRDGVALGGDLPHQSLQAGDRLVLACRPTAIIQARENTGIDFVGERGLDLEPISAHEGAIVEGVIGPMSTIVGKTIREINFRQRYRMIILAVHRRGRNVREKLETLPLDFGDTLLMMGTDKAIENMHNTDDIILLDRPQLPAQDMRRRMPLVIAVIAGMIGAVTFLDVPIFAMAVLAVAILFVTGTIKPKDAYSAIEWRILILIYGMLGLGLALQDSGATELASAQLVHLVDGFPQAWQPIVMLAFVYLATSIMTEVLSNNATVVLMAPVALALGEMLGVDPRPFIIAACIGSSASFATPIGYQTNTYVYGVGGYRFGDFARVGIPLNVLYFIGSMILIPLFWHF